MCLGIRSRDTVIPEIGNPATPGIRISAWAKPYWIPAFAGMTILGAQRI